MSLLPGRILPQDVPFGQAAENGEVIIEQNWWLLLYNLCSQVLGTSTNGIPADALIDLESVEIDAIGTDVSVLRRALDSALLQAFQPDPPTISLADLPDLQRALLLAQDGLLPDPAPLAQPVSSITPGASPFTYTASFAGTVAITGGTVSAIALLRQGTTVATGLTVGLIPVSRYDRVQVTYTAAPTMTFIPWSSQ